MSHSLHVSSPSPVPAPEAVGAVERLLREILECIDSDETSSAIDLESSDQSNAVVLDIQVDGIAYKLMRAGSTSASNRQALSPREQEIVRLVAKGLPSKAIADVLDMSTWTVGSHLRRIFAKLGVGTRAEMVAHVLEGGLLDERASGTSN